MRALLVVLAVLATGCPRTLSETDKAVLQDFRTVDRATLARAAELERDQSMRLSDIDDFTKAIKTDLVEPWQAMRARVKVGELKLGDDLSKALTRYLDEREVAWSAWGRSITDVLYGIESKENFGWKFRENTDAANADAKIIEAKLASLKLPALPPMPAPPRVDFTPPPVDTTPGAAFFRVADKVIRLDDQGFRTIATEIDTMDVLPDGTMWACSIWHLVHWDGTKATEYKPKIPINACAAAPDGSVYVINDNHYDNKPDQLGRFDGKKWTITNAVIGDLSSSTEALRIDRDGRLYALNRGSMGGDGVYLLDKTWRQLALQKTSGSGYVSQILRGNDGYIWAVYQMQDRDHYPAGFARLQLGGGDEPAYVANYFQQEQLYPFIDAAGHFTLLDPRRNVIEQAKKLKKLPLPVSRRYWDRDNLGAFAYDGAGRIWIDLVDGLHVMESGDKQTIYPRGSIDLIRQPIRTIVVTGGGPKLVPPSPVVTRTITGQIRGAGKVQLELCADSGSRECPPGLPVWKTYSDAEGAFTFEKVPQFGTMSIQGYMGVSGDKSWEQLSVECCGDKDALGEVGFVPPPQY